MMRTFTKPPGLGRGRMEASGIVTSTPQVSPSSTDCLEKATKDLEKETATMPIPKAADDAVTSTDQGTKNIYILCYVQSNLSEEASATYRHDRTTISNERHRSNMSGLSKQRGTKKCQYEVISETKGSESERRQTPRRKPRKALNPKKKRKLNKSKTKTSNNQSEVSHTKTNKNKSDTNPKKNEGCDYFRRRKKSDVEKKKCAWKLKPPTFYCSNTLTIAKSIFYASLTPTKRGRQETTRSLSLHHNPVVKPKRRCITKFFDGSITLYEIKLSFIQGCTRLGEKEGRIGNLRTEEEVRRLKIVSERTQRRTKILINILATNNNKMVGPRAPVISQPFSGLLSTSPPPFLL